MHRNILKGVVSQAGDPAKVLADAYCAYVTTQGGATDYATIYNIYKDEYLTDPDKEKIVSWFDFRAGKKASPTGGGQYYGLYSLISPYYFNATIHSINATFTVGVNGECLPAVGIPNLRHSALYLNDNGTDFNVREIIKVYIPATVSANLYLTQIYGQFAYTTFSTRIVAASRRAYGYMYSFDGTAYISSPAVTITNEVVTIDHTLIWRDRSHYVSTKEVSKSSDPAVDKVATPIHPTTPASNVGSTYNINVYFWKYYKL